MNLFITLLSICPPERSEASVAGEEFAFTAVYEIWRGERQA